MPQENKRLHTKKELSERRRELRQKMTPAEAFLWNHLKSKKLDGRRFTRQHSIGNYVVDFYCASERLIVELDGKVHQNAQAMEYDAIRTSYIETMGYKVIRFENKMVFDNYQSVIMGIRDNYQNVNS